MKEFEKVNGSWLLKSRAVFICKIKDFESI